MAGASPLLRPLALPEGRAALLRSSFLSLVTASESRRALHRSGVRAPFSRGPGSCWFEPSERFAPPLDPGVSRLPAGVLLFSTRRLRRVGPGWLALRRELPRAPSPVSFEAWVRSLSRSLTSTSKTQFLLPRASLLASCSPEGSLSASRSSRMAFHELFGLPPVSTESRATSALRPSRGPKASKSPSPERDGQRRRLLAGFHTRDT